MWIYLGFIAALFLGAYNIAKKWSVHQNAILSVLWLSHFSGFLFLLSLMLFAKTFPSMLGNHFFELESLTLSEHLFLAGKSAIISTSWALGFKALKHLPLSLVASLRAAGPVFTILGAVIFFGERPNLYQSIGIILILIAVQGFASLSRFDNILFFKNKYVLYALGATLLGASSGLYDKFLLQSKQFAVHTLQFWFSFYLVLFLGLLWLLFYRVQKEKTPFQWRWSIPLIGIFLILSDRFYFTALSEKGVMVLLLSALKRSQIFITVLLGAWIFKEKKIREKFLALMGVFIGLIFLLLGS